MAKSEEIKSEEKLEQLVQFAKDAVRWKERVDSNVV